MNLGLYIRNVKILLHYMKILFCIWTARQEQLGVRCPAQGHFDTPRVGSNLQPSSCQTIALAPEPYHTT